jgi:hypothetical protein
MLPARTTSTTGLHAVGSILFRMHSSSLRLLRVLSALTLTSSSLSAVFNVSAAFVRMHRWRTSPRLDAQLFFWCFFVWSVQLSNSSTISLSVPAGASVLINVHSSPEIGEGYVKLSGALLGAFVPDIADHVLWNFNGVRHHASLDHCHAQVHLLCCAEL